MTMIRFLHLRLGRQFAAWFLLTITAVAFDSLSIGLLLPLISEPESDSAIGELVYLLFETVGVEYSLLSALLFVAGAYTARNLMFMLQGLVASRSIASLQTDAKLQTVDNISRLGYEYFSRTDAGLLNNAVTLEFNNMAEALRHFTFALVCGLFSLSMFLLAFVIEPPLALATVAISVPAYLVMRKATGFLQGLSTRNTLNNSILQALMTQMLAAFKYLSATGTNDRIAGRMQESIRTQGRLLRTQRSVATLLSNGIDLALVLTLLGFVIFYTDVVGKSLVEAVFILVIIRRGISYGIQGQERFQQFLEFSGSIRLFQQLDRELPERQEPAGSNTIPPDFSQPIEFRHVSFGYSSSREVLNDLSLTIPPNSKVAIVGSSGSGKSTLVSMLPGLLRPISGMVTMGDSPYGKIDQAALRSNIGYVTQETVIFNDSVENNITLWDPRADDARVRQALDASASTEFVNRLPEGLGTVIGDEGATLSGGQRQRIAIARELYKKPQLLICDEGMSALGSDTENSILSSIEEMRGTGTLVLVAHRLSTTRHCDLIYVLEDGRVVEQGGYDELYAALGTFRAMVDRQRPSGRRVQGKQAVDELDSGAPLAYRFTRQDAAGVPSGGRRHPSGQGICVWFTGLSGAGKTTTAEALTVLLTDRGCRVTLLDGDAARAGRSGDLGFSREDRDANILSIALAAREAVNAGDIAVCAAISPYADTRDAARSMIGADRFLEVYVNTPVRICEERDPKGLYAMARRGEIRNFTGIDDPYEAPPAPDVELETVRHSAEDNAQTVLAELQARGLAG